MASVKKTKFDTWRASVSVNYKRPTKTFKTKSEAVAWASMMESTLLSGSPLVSDMPFSQLIQKYIDKVSSEKDGERWERIRLQALMRDFPDLCNKPLSQLSKRDFIEWRDKRSKKVSASSVLREKGLISPIFTYAIDELQVMTASPMKGIKWPTEAPPRDRLPTQDETEALLIALDYSEDGELTTISSRVGAALLFAYETAMRAKEICNLRLGHINGSVAKVITSKTRTGVREVPLSPRALHIIDRLKRVDIEGDSIFNLRTSQIDSLFRKAKLRAGIDGLTFHDSRAEGITRLSKKVDILALARIVGHKDIRMLQVYYRESAEDISKRL